MKDPVKIFIVEDEMIIGANISLQLSNLGYEVTGIVPRGEEALIHIQQNIPDIVILDIQLKGKLDGVETAKIIQKKYGVPVIYLTANVDQTNFDRAKETNPYAFISKPFKKLDLQRAVALAVGRIQLKNNNSQLKNNTKPTPTFVLEDSIFVKHHEKMVKILINDILYIEAERNYCRIITKDKESLLVMTLKDIDQKLPKIHFLRIHRSFIVNLSKIEEVANTHVVISRKAVPISKSLRNELLNRLQTI